MKLLAATIFKICSSLYPITAEEKMLTCFDKYVNCVITPQVLNADRPEMEALKRLNFCQYKTVK